MQNNTTHTDRHAKSKRGWDSEEKKTKTRWRGALKARETTSAKKAKEKQEIFHIITPLFISRISKDSSMPGPLDPFRMGPAPCSLLLLLTMRIWIVVFLIKICDTARGVLSLRDRGGGSGIG